MLFGRKSLYLLCELRPLNPGHDFKGLWFLWLPLSKRLTISETAMVWPWCFVLGFYGRRLGLGSGLLRRRQFGKSYFIVLLVWFVFFAW